MRDTAFKIIDAAPSKVGSILFALVTLYATAKPDEAGDLLDDAMSADNIQFYGIVGLALVVAYWSIWLWLRPKSSSAVENAMQDNRRGNFNDGTVHGGQHYYEGAPLREMPQAGFQGSEFGADPEAYIRLTEPGYERQRFAETICKALENVGVSPTLQLGFSQTGMAFPGVMVKAAPNEAAQAFGAAFVNALTDAGLDVFVGDAVEGWEGNSIQVIVGESV